MRTNEKYRPVLRRKVILYTVKDSVGQCTIFTYNPIIMKTSMNSSKQSKQSVVKPSSMWMPEERTIFNKPTKWIARCLCVLRCCSCKWMRTNNILCDLHFESHLIPTLTLTKSLSFARSLSRSLVCRYVRNDWVLLQNKNSRECIVAYQSSYTHANTSAEFQLEFEIRSETESEIKMCASVFVYAIVSLRFVSKGQSNKINWVKQLKCQTYSISTFSLSLLLMKWSTVFGINSMSNVEISHNFVRVSVPMVLFLFFTFSLMQTCFIAL